MDWTLELQQSLVTIDDRSRSGKERVVAHPARGSVVCVSNAGLLELDVATGATTADVAFDLPLASAAATADVSPCSLDLLSPVGSDHLVGVCQSSNLVVWNLREESLECIVDLERGQSSKGVVALAASLCRDKWLFYCVEGSATIKVVSLSTILSSSSCGDGKDHGLPTKKIVRKTTNRSCQLTTLAYRTSLRLLACGSTDGTFQLWAYASSGREDDGGAGSSAKDDAAPVSLLFTSSVTASTSSPVVHLAFTSSASAPPSSATSTSSHYLVVAYQNRTVDVWTLGPLVAGQRPRDPQRVASTQLPPQATDFARKNGELSFAMYPQLPLLTIGWSPNMASSSPSVAVWHFGDGGGRGNSIKWSDVKAVNRNADRPVVDSDSSAGMAICWLNQSLRMCAFDPSGLSLTAFKLQSPTVKPPAVQDACVPVRDVYSSVLTLSLEQYHHYHDTPTTLLQVSSRRSASKGPSDVFLQQFSLLTGSSGTENKLHSLPGWKNYQGAQLVPWQLLTNTSQSAVCVKLRGREGAAEASTEAYPYVVMEINKTASGSSTATSQDDDSSSSSNARSGSSVKCGGQMDALDLCFCPPQATADFSMAGDDTAWRLLVLSITGKSLSFQTQCDQVDSSGGIPLNQQVRRVFTTPMRLSPASPHAQTVGVRLLYMLAQDDSSSDTLVLSGDDLSVPASRSSGCYWCSQAGEQVLDVQWNQSSSSATTEMLAAVWTSRRLVILSGPNLTEIRAYDLRDELQEPQSSLWVAQSLLIVARDLQVRYLTPMVSDDEVGIRSSGQLLCSLRVQGASGSQTVQLVAVCGDRLCYTVNDSSTLECRTFTRPVSLCEPLLLGFDASASTQTRSMLRAVFEREVLVFLQSGGDSPACPLSNAVLEAAYHCFGWKKAVVQVLHVALGRSGDLPTASSNVSSNSAVGATAGASSGGFSRAAHLSRPLLASILVDSHKWRDALRLMLADDPALEEYAFTDCGDDDGGGVSTAKLPSRTSLLARQFQQLARVMDAVGQRELAVRCLDLAGDDLGLLELLRRLGSESKSDARGLLAALSKDLARLNGPLSSAVEATLNGPNAEEDQQEFAAKLASTVLRRHDLATLLCCETLQQIERRSRLLPTVRPFDKLAVSPIESSAKEEAEQQERQAVAPAKLLAWKRLAPEDAIDWLGGTSAAVKVAADAPKPLSYSLFASGLTAVSGDLVTTSGSALGSSTSLSGIEDTTSVNTAANNSKTTIGPFLEEEDAVVAYWRFEEGGNKAVGSDEGSSASLESVDTSKRMNHLMLRGFGSAVKLVPSTAPVDRGEEGKVQEAFALQFPSSTVESDGGSVSCVVPAGGTLDVGFVYDEDPYRRKLTVEAWVHDYAQAIEQQQQRDEAANGDGTKPPSQSTPSCRRSLASRRSPDGSTLYWELAEAEDGRLELQFGSARVVQAETPVENVGAWHHVAFTADVSSFKLATLRLFVNAVCVASQEVATVEANAVLQAGAKDSVLSLGDTSLRDCEMAEVRVWASARSAEQLGDMKENYLAMAEAKRRMKVAIHQRNCACAKCAARRSAAVGGGLNSGGGGKTLPLVSPFMAAPPSTGSSRDRRRPGNK